MTIKKVNLALKLVEHEQHIMGARQLNTTN